MVNTLQSEKQESWRVIKKKKNQRKATFFKARAFSVWPRPYSRIGQTITCDCCIGSVSLELMTSEK